MAEEQRTYLTSTEFAKRVWAPEGSGVQVLSGRREGTALVSWGRDDGLKIIATPGPGIARSINAYSRLRAPRERALRRLTAGVTALGLAHLPHPLTQRINLVGDAGTSAPELLHQLMGESAGLATPRCLLVARKPRDHYKPTVTLMTGEGTAVGFAKLGWTPATASLVEHERASLAEVAETMAPDIRVPRLIGSGQHFGRPFLVCEPLPHDSVRHDQRLPADRVLKTLAGRQSLVPVGALPLWSAATTRVSTVRRHELLTAARRVLATSWAGGVRSGRAHGDFVPWNAAHSAVGLVVWDWEHFEALAPLGTDSFHWLLMGHRRLDMFGWPECFRLSEQELASRWPIVDTGMSPVSLALYHAATLLTLSDSMSSSGALEPYPVDEVLPSLIARASQESQPR